jgi:hypothetical protein
MANIVASSVIEFRDRAHIKSIDFIDFLSSIQAGPHHRWSMAATPAERELAGSLCAVPAISSALDRQRNDPTFADIWEEIDWRGLVHVSTDAGELKTLLAGPPITYYCGFDPTARSLHLGNLVQLLLMRRLQLAGHRPLGLIGGSTGLIGDPRPTAERTLNTKDTSASRATIPRAWSTTWTGRKASAPSTSSATSASTSASGRCSRRMP